MRIILRKKRKEIKGRKQNQTFVEKIFEDIQKSCDANKTINGKGLGLKCPSL